MTKTMAFEELKGEIEALMSNYNAGLEPMSQERVTAADLHIAKSADCCTEDAPGLVCVVPKAMQTEMPAAEPAPRSLSAAATVASSSIECCAVGWVGLQRNGVFLNCFPIAGQCQNFTGPNKCVIPV